MTQQEVNTLLMERAQSIEKKKNRLAFFLYIIPIIYFLFHSAVLEQVEYGFIRISQFEIINVFTPIVYSIMVFYFVYLNEDSKALRQRIDIPETKEKVPYFFSHGYLVFPPNLIFELLRNLKHKDFTGELGTILIFPPLLIVLLFGPLVFLFYSCYSVLFGSTIEAYYLNYISLGLAIWIFLATLLYSYNRKKETKRLNSL